jgi:hypothetical protein
MSDVWDETRHRAEKPATRLVDSDGERGREAVDAALKSL